MQKLNLLGFTLLLICFAHYSHAQGYTDKSASLDRQAAHQLSYNLNPTTRISGNLVKHETAPRDSFSWFSIQPFSEFTSILLMIFGLGLVYLADYRKRKAK